MTKLKKKAPRAAKKGTPVKKKTGPVPAAKKKAAPVTAKATKKAIDDKKKTVAKPAAKKPEMQLKPTKGKKLPPPVSMAKKANGKAPEALPPKGKKAAEPVVAKGKVPAAKPEKGADKGRKVAKEAPPEIELKGETTEEEGPEEVFLTDAEGRRYCRVKDCDQISMVDGYCRYHYLLFWKKIQVRKKILSEGKLERYIEELTARYPDKYLEMLRKDLKSEKEFLAAITELEIDDTGVDTEYEEDAQSYLEEVRGISSESSERSDEEF